MTHVLMLLALPGLLADANSDNPYLAPTALTFYGVVLVALIGGPGTLIVKARLETAAAAAAGRRKTAEDDAARETAEADRKAKEDSDSVAWLRGQVDRLQKNAEAQARRNTERDRQTAQLERQVHALRSQMLERDDDDMARDGRISQLEGAMRHGELTVPPPLPDYAALLGRAARRRLDRDDHGRN